MKKKEVKDGPNEVLIFELCRMMNLSYVAKGNIKTAKMICEELQNRGAISCAEDLFDRWHRAYTR